MAEVEDADATVAFNTRLDARTVAITTQLAGIVTSVNDAATANNQINLLAALTFFNNVDENLIVTYRTDINNAESDAKNTVDKIQNIINTQVTKVANNLVNIVISSFAGTGVPTDAKITAAQEAINTLAEDLKAPLQGILNDSKVVKAVKVAIIEQNQIKLNTALANSKFARVNTAYLVDYAGIDITDIAAIAGVQAGIDAVNLAKAQAKVTAAQATVSRADLNAAEALVNALVDSADKEAELAKLEAHALVVTVSEATTTDALKTALDAIEADYNEVLLPEYLTAITPATVPNKNTAEKIQTIINTVNSEQLTAAITAVLEVTEETTLEAFTALLQRLSDVSDDFDIATVNTLLLQNYIDAIIADQAEITPTATDAASIQALIQDVTDTALDTYIADIIAADTEEAILAALQAEYLNLQNVIEANAPLYLAEITAAADKDSVAKIQALVSVSNFVAQVNATTDAAAMRSLLFDLGNVDYTNLSSTAKAEVAQLVIDDIDANTEYTVLSDVTAALAAEITNYKALLSGVNNATTIATMTTALGTLNIDSFAVLTPEQKATVAEKVLGSKPTSGYTSIAQIKAAM